MISTSQPGGSKGATFASLAHTLRPDARRGCSSQMALVEYPEPGSGPRLRAVEAKAWMLERLTDLAGAFRAEHASGRDAALLGRQLFLVYEGLVASALSGPSDKHLDAGLALVGTPLDAGRPARVHSSTAQLQPQARAGQ